MLLLVFSPVASLEQPRFSTLSHKEKDFWEKVFNHKMCV
jgi:hypothetical protein